LGDFFSLVGSCKLKNLGVKERFAMTEIVFLVEDDPDGGYTARALTESIFTQADDIEILREMIRDAVHCHFPNEQNRPKIIRLHIVRDEVIAS
jgi:hypothetical protein